jgi:radical SAM protein with 4Fe4S-binding SPASM domain
MMTNFCHAPWMHIYTNPDGRLMPCCLFDDNNTDFPNLNEKPLEEALNHPKLVAIRKQLLNNEVPAGCYKCEAQRNMNQVPYKNKMDNLATEKHLPENCNSDGTLNFDDMEPTYLDIRFGNLCNLKCRTCSHDFSSAIAAEYNKMYNLTLPVLHSLDQSAIDKIYSKLGSVKSIYLAGGEPLLEENNVKLLNYLIENNLKPELCYNTNLTTISFKHVNYFDLWKNFPVIDLHISIDGYKEVNDYIRFGSSYDKLISNIRTIKENVPHARIVINTVASNMSIHSLPSLGKDLIGQGFVDDMMFSICHFPKIYDPTVLTTETKQELTKIFDDYVIWLKSQSHSFIPEFIDKCIGLIEYMNSEDNSALLSDTKNTLSIQDKFRNTDHTKVLKL